MLAAEIMRSSFATVKPTTSVLDALRLLLETNQRGLPVIDNVGALDLHGHVTSVAVADHVLYMSTGIYRCGK